MPRNEPAAAPMLRRFKDIRDFAIGATDGEVGTIDDVYLDDASWTVRYLVVSTGWLSGRQVLLAPPVLRGFSETGRRLDTSLTRRQVEDSPSIDTARPVSRQQEIALQSHYGYEPFWGGPLRWGPYAYPYPLLHGGVLPPWNPPRHGDRVAEEIEARERQGYDEHLRSAREVSGYGIRATDGDLGHVEDFLIDEREWAIRYLIVDPRSWWPGPHVIIATDWITGVSWDDSVVSVGVTRNQVRNAPTYEPSGSLQRDEEERLYAHYRRPGYWDRRPEAWTRYPPAA